MSPPERHQVPGVLEQDGDEDEEDLEGSLGDLEGDGLGATEPFSGFEREDKDSEDFKRRISSVVEGPVPPERDEGGMMSDVGDDVDVVKREWGRGETKVSQELVDRGSRMGVIPGRYVPAADAEEGGGAQRAWEEMGEKGTLDVEDPRLKARRIREEALKPIRAYPGGCLSPSLRTVEALQEEEAEVRRRLREEANIDQWSESLWPVADDYNVTQLEVMLSKARVAQALEPGKPLWVQLPMGGNNWVDASRLTTGTLIEAILTNGKMLDRDEQGNVIRPEDMPPEFGRTEPIRSILRHRLVMGVDDWAVSEEEDKGGRTMDEWLNEEMGPYRETYERIFFGPSNYSLDDEDRIFEMYDWKMQCKVDLAKGQNKTNRMLWKALADEKYLDAEALVKVEGAQMEALDDEDGLNALQKCLSRQDEEGADLLLRLGADLEAQDWEGRSSLLVACWYAEPEMANLTLKRGANLHAVDKNGCGCIHQAATSGAEVGLKPLFDLLLNAGANLYARDVWGRTPRELSRALRLVSSEEYLAAVEEGGELEATLIGRDLSKPNPYWQVIPGGTLFVDSSDSNADPEGPFYEEFRKVKKMRKDPPTWPQIPQNASVNVTPVALDYMGKKSRTHRQYDGTDWACSATQEDVDRLTELFEMAPGAFLTDQEMEEWIKKGWMRMKGEDYWEKERQKLDIDRMIDEYGMEESDSFDFLGGRQGAAEAARAAGTFIDTE